LALVVTIPNNTPPELLLTCYNKLPTAFDTKLASGSFAFELLLVKEARMQSQDPGALPKTERGMAPNWTSIQMACAVSCEKRRRTRSSAHAHTVQ
jgi:hypothetical protein